MYLQKDGKLVPSVNKVNKYLRILPSYTFLKYDVDF